MIFKLHKKNGLTMVYGFESNKAETYMMVMSLLQNHNTTWIYGLLSQVKMNLHDFKQLWEYLQNVIKTKYLMIEVLPKHSKIYKFYLNVVHVKKTRTFNGFESETLRIILPK